MKILVVDDSKTMRMLVKRTLRQAGIEADAVAEAANGQDAFDLVEADRPDLLLCDWNMPGISGLELLEKLKSASCKARFGFVTSESTDYMRNKAIEAGDSFLIGKPFTADDFRDVLERVQQ